MVALRGNRVDDGSRSVWNGAVQWLVTAKDGKAIGRDWVAVQTGHWVGAVGVETERRKTVGNLHAGTFTDLVPFSTLPLFQSILSL